MDDMRKSALDKRAELLASTRATVEQELSAATRACSRNHKRRAPRSIATHRTWRARLCRASSAGPPRTRSQGVEVLRHSFLAACELKRKVATAVSAVCWCLRRVPAFAQEHPPPAARRSPLPNTAQPADGDTHSRPKRGRASRSKHRRNDSRAWCWPVANFIIFVGVIYYFCNKPLKEYLAGRSSTIRKDLVEAAELKATATAQLADHRTETAGAARRARQRCARAAPKTSRPKRRASPPPRPPIANACSSRRAARSSSRCGSRRKKFSNTRPISRCSSRPSASRKKSRRKIRSRLVDRYLDQVKKS